MYMEGMTESEYGDEKPSKRAKKTILKRILSSVLKMKMKTFTTSVVLFIVIVLAGYIYFEKKAWFVAATVDGSPVSRLSVIRELEKQGGKDVLENMITKKLLADEIHRLKIVVKKADIDAEVKKAEDLVSSQGGTLDEALEQQGMTRQDLIEQILMKKQLEQILAEKIVVSDEEIDAYLKENRLAPTKNMNAAELRTQVQEQLRSTKFSTEAKKMIADLHEKAAIVHYVAY